MDLRYAGVYTGALPGTETLAGHDAFILNRMWMPKARPGKNWLRRGGRAGRGAAAQERRKRHQRARPKNIRPGRAPLFP